MPIRNVKALILTSVFLLTASVMAGEGKLHFYFLKPVSTKTCCSSILLFTDGTILTIENLSAAKCVATYGRETILSMPYDLPYQSAIVKGNEKVISIENEAYFYRLASDDEVFTLLINPAGNARISLIRDPTQIWKTTLYRRVMQQLIPWRGVKPKEFPPFQPLHLRNHEVP